VKPVTDLPIGARYGFEHYRDAAQWLRGFIRHRGAPQEKVLSSQRYARNGSLALAELAEARPAPRAAAGIGAGAFFRVQSGGWLR
jgi:hypothetical protein